MRESFGLDDLPWMATVLDDVMSPRGDVSSYHDWANGESVSFHVKTVRWQTERTAMDWYRQEFLSPCWPTQSSGWAPSFLHCPLWYDLLHQWTTQWDLATVEKLCLALTIFKFQPVHLRWSQTDNGLKLLELRDDLILLSVSIVYIYNVCIVIYWKCSSKSQRALGIRGEREWLRWWMDGLFIQKLNKHPRVDNIYVTVFWIQIEIRSTVISYTARDRRIQ